MGQLTITDRELYLEYCLSGTFDDESMYQMFDDLWTAPDYRFTHNELYDYRLADFKQLTIGVIQKIVHLRRRLNTDKLQLSTARCWLTAISPMEYREWWPRSTKN